MTTIRRLRKYKMNKSHKKYKGSGLKSFLFGKKKSDDEKRKDLLREIKKYAQEKGFKIHIDLEKPTYFKMDKNGFVIDMKNKDGTLKRINPIDYRSIRFRNLINNMIKFNKLFPENNLTQEETNIISSVLAAEPDIYDLPLDIDENIINEESNDDGSQEETKGEDSNDERQRKHKLARQARAKLIFKNLLEHQIVTIENSLSRDNYDEEKLFAATNKIIDDALNLMNKISDITDDIEEDLSGKEKTQINNKTEEINNKIQEKITKIENEDSDLKVFEEESIKLINIIIIGKDYLNYLLDIQEKINKKKKYGGKSKKRKNKNKRNSSRK